jgi:uncharacterized protein
MSHTAQYWIKTLKLTPHPEGGYYRETYRSPEIISGAHLPERYNGRRPFSTAIYFLLRAGQFSAFHRLKSDEIWHFYTGMPVEIFIIQKSGTLKKIKLGLNPKSGEQPQVVIEANAWFAAALAGYTKIATSPQNGKWPLGPSGGADVENRKSYALLGCTVAPGFDFADFELGRQLELTALFPRHRALIEQLTI